MQHNKSIHTRTIAAPIGTRYGDLAQLCKLKLSSMVVISAVLAYLIMAQGQTNMTILVLLVLGGFAITAAANALNQILEKDYDGLMARTANRPLPTQRMQVTDALLFAGLCFVSGIILLALINPLAALLGALSAVLYAFLYTPLKRETTFSVFVGAIPGALPVLIGAVAFDGRLTAMALVLFAIQFFWQFPHFWAIGFLGFDDYRKAGYRLMPEQEGKVHRNIGFQCLLFSLFLLPFCFAPYFLDWFSIGYSFVALAVTLGYAYFSWILSKNHDRKSARSLMFYSFGYLPLVLIIFYIGTSWS